MRYLRPAVIVLLALAAASAPVLAQTPPANDDFANATVLGADAGSLIAETNEDASAEAGEPNHNGVTPSRSVWYQWTPSVDGNAVVAATTQPYLTWDIVIGVYTGSAVNALTEVASDGGLVNRVEVEVRVTAGTNYYLAIDGQTSSETGSFDLTWSIPSPPNDDFSEATTLTAASGWLLGETNEWASAEPGEPDHRGVTPSRSVWYDWTPSANGTAVVKGSTPYSGNYIVMVAYTGSAVDALTEVAAWGGWGFTNVRLEFGVVTGTTYHIVLDGSDESETGSFDLTWALSPPANDDFADAPVLAERSGTLAGETTEGATPEIGEPTHAGVAGTPARSVWYEWTPIWDGSATIDVDTPAAPDDWDSVVAVYTGSALVALTEVVATSTVGTNLHLEFEVVAGTTYRLVVDGRDTENWGSFDLTWAYDPYDGTFIVTKTEDTDDGVCDTDCSLREAVVAANATGGNDTIHLPAGTYQLTLDWWGVADHFGSLDIERETGTTSILGAGRDVTVIDATTLRTLGVSFPDRVFSVGYHAGLELIGVTVTGGYTDNFGSAHQDGGGIWNWNGYLTVTDSLVEGNFAGVGGGGIANHFGPATITNTIIRNNTTDPPDYTNSSNWGGGILNTGTMTIISSEITDNSTNHFGFGGGIGNAGVLEVIDSTISGNHAKRGGGIGTDWAMTSGDEWMVTVTNSTISDNHAHADSNGPGQGGGIFNDGGGILNPGGDVTFTVLDSTVAGNTVDIGDGGGVFNNGGVVEIHRSTLSGNFANGGGGGVFNESIYTWMAGIVTISNSTVSGNGATYGGGAANYNRASTNIENATITDNIAFIGGGIANIGTESATVTMENTIVAGNVAPPDPPPPPESEDCTGAITTAGHNLLGLDTGCPSSGTGDLTTADPMLGPLTDNGGPAQTHALLPGSPAIDAGDNTACPETDQRGVVRPQDAACDIGAYELCAANPDCDGDSQGLGDPFGLFLRDTVELFMGTLPLVACAATPATDDEDPDALGPDWDDSQGVDGSDLFLFAERFGTEKDVPPPVGKQPYIERFDIYPTDASLHKIDGSDLFVLASYFGDSCP